MVIVNGLFLPFGVIVTLSQGAASMQIKCVLICREMQAGLDVVCGKGSATAAVAMYGV